MTEWSEQREAELREAGFSEAEIRDYRRGFESDAPEPRSWLPDARPAREAPQYLNVADHFPPHSERGQWQRDTSAGRLSRLLPPVEDAADLAAAKELQDQREYTYGNRPELQACLTAVRHTGPRVMEITGTTEEVAQMLRAAGLGCRIVQEYDPPAVAPGSHVTRV